MMVTAFLDSPVSFAWLAAAVVGWVAGAAVLVALGAPSRRPTAQAVIDGLCQRRAARCSELRPGGRRRPRVDAVLRRAPRTATSCSSRRSARTSAAPICCSASTGGSSRRDLGDEKPFSTLRRAVEHEALVALAARDLPVRTPRLRAFATAEPNGYVLAYDKIEGRSLDRLDPAEVTDDVLAADLAPRRPTAAAPHRPPRPAAGEHLPRRRR